MNFQWNLYQISPRNQVFREKVGLLAYITSLSNCAIFRQDLEAINEQL